MTHLNTIKKKTFCSICTAFCGFNAEIEDNHILNMLPDADHPMSQGFSCSKGRQFHHLLTAPNRLTRCMKRSNGTLLPIEKSVALDELAAKLDAIRAEFGPESIAFYCGNGATFKTTPMPAVHAWMQGLGSHQIYTSLTIDQPAKIVSVGRHGLWAGGIQDFESAEVSMLIGNNVTISSLHMPGGPPGWRPGAIKEAKKRGLKLIVVDPRKTETAQLADLYLPIRPGEDATLLAGMIKFIMDNNLYDSEFCNDYVAGFDELRQALAPFTQDYVAQRSGLNAVNIKAAVDIFVAAKRGIASSATGPDMGPHGNLTEHLISCLNTLCGRHNRAGEKLAFPSLLIPNLPPVAAVVPRAFYPEKLNPDMNTQRARLSGAHQVFKEMPTATLADEILTDGKGQIKALIVVGGNPMTSWPDQAKTLRALQALELLVCIDVRQSDTAELAHYVLPASYGLERAELTAYNDFLYNKPFHQFADKLVEPPGDACEEWIYLAELAQRLQLTMTLPGGDVDLNNLPSPTQFIELLYPEHLTKVPVQEIMRHEGGKVFEEFANPEVLPAFEGMDDKLQLLPDGVAAEIQQLLNNPIGIEGQFGAQKQFTHLLTARRNKYVYNSMCHELPQTAKNNPAFLHSSDIEKLGAAVGQVLRLVSSYGVIHVQLAADDALRPGVVSVSHGFGGGVVDEARDDIATVSRLMSTDNTFDRIARMPIMSALPVRFEQL